MKPKRMAGWWRRFPLCLWLVLALGYGTGLAASSSVLHVGAFSEEDATHRLPSHWEPIHFKRIERHTDYRLVEADGQVVIKARADASASGLIRRISIDPRKYPLVQWRWRVSNILDKGNVHQKSGDDYPARLYILFEYHPDKLGFFEKVKYEAIKLFYGEYPPLASINYIWASNAPEGMIVPNPFTEKAIMVVVESGTARLDTWVHEERNVYTDYENAFNTTPPLISGVAIMTDTDNTGESATAYYGDIRFLKGPP